MYLVFFVDILKTKANFKEPSESFGKFVCRQEIFLRRVYNTLSTDRKQKIKNCILPRTMDRKPY